jgi:hypothetical protein
VLVVHDLRTHALASCASARAIHKSKSYQNHSHDKMEIATMRFQMTQVTDSLQVRTEGRGSLQLALMSGADAARLHHFQDLKH